MLFVPELPDGEAPEVEEATPSSYAKKPPMSKELFFKPKPEGGDIIFYIELESGGEY